VTEAAMASTISSGEKHGVEGCEQIPSFKGHYGQPEKRQEAAMTARVSLHVMAFCPIMVMC
jgi:hypothetical protein